MAVFALFRAEVREIDVGKRAVLSQLLAESVVATAAGETLDEKLAALTFQHADCAYPSRCLSDKV